MGFLPEGRVAKVHHAKNKLSDSCAGLEGPIIPGLGTCFRVSLGGGISNMNVWSYCASKGSFCL